MPIKITQVGTTGTQFARMLAVNRMRMGDMTPFYDEAVHIFWERADDIFESEGKNLQHAPQWKKLKPATLKQKASKYGSSKPLQNTGKLKKSRKKKVNRRTGELEFTAHYAKYHSKGTERLPRRDFVDIDDKTGQRVTKALQKHIQDKDGAFDRVY